MKKIICFVLALALTLCVMPMYADSGSCRLKAIKIGDFGIPGFDPDVTEYTAYVPYVYHENDFDTIAVPAVTAWCEDESSFVSVRYPETADGTITVTVKNGGDSKTYSFKLEPAGKNYYLNGSMEYDGYWVYHGQGASEPSYTNDAAAGARGIKIPVHKEYILTLKQDNGAPALACTASKPTVSGYDYLFTALSKVSEDCSIAPGDWTCDNETIKHYKVTDDNIASENSGGSKRDGTSDWYSATTDRYQRTISIMREKDNETRYLDTSYCLSRAPRELYMDEVYASELTVASLKYTGDTFAEGGKTVHLTASVENAYGNSAGMEYASFEYRLIGNYDGVGINGDTLTVSEDASAKSVLLEVVCHPGFKSIQCPGENSVIPLRKYALRNRKTTEHLLI